MPVSFIGYNNVFYGVYCGHQKVFIPGAEMINELTYFKGFPVLLGSSAYITWAYNRGDKPNNIEMIYNRGIFFCRAMLFTGLLTVPSATYSFTTCNFMQCYMLKYNTHAW